MTEEPLALIYQRLRDRLKEVECEIAFMENLDRLAEVRESAAPAAFGGARRTAWERIEQSLGIAQDEALRQAERRRNA